MDCVANQMLCMNQRVQAFPTLRLFKDSVVQPPDYRSDRTVDALMEYSRTKLSVDETVAKMTPHEQQAHKELNELHRDDHPGCLMSGFLLVNRSVDCCIHKKRDSHVVGEMDLILLSYTA